MQMTAGSVEYHAHAAGEAAAAGPAGGRAGRVSDAPASKP
jgi:hypothetical protein